jgi:hypothetical protein
MYTKLGWIILGVVEHESYEGYGGHKFTCVDAEKTNKGMGMYYPL